MDYLTRADDIIAIYVDIHREYTKAKTDSIYKQLTSRIYRSKISYSECVVNVSLDIRAQVRSILISHCILASRHCRSTRIF